MKVLLAAGSHPRHAHIARAMHQSGMLAALIIEQREPHITDLHFDGHFDKQMLRLHFNKRAEAEEQLMGSDRFPEVKTLRVGHKDLNGPEVHRFLRDIDPDLLLTYGVHILRPETLACVNGERWNIHGGLSPWYKGAITHFWPSYLLEPQMTGMTVHELTDDLDAGPVVHQSAAPLIRGDGLHQLACRAVTGLAEELPQLLGLASSDRPLPRHQHKTSGRVWRSADWHPCHLRLIYDVYQDRIVDHYLDHQLTQRAPELHRQF